MKLANDAVTFGLMAAIAVFGFLGWRSFERHVGAEKERARINTKGEKTDAQAQKARARVALDADLGRVLQRTCRDCGASVPHVEAGRGQ